MYHQLDQPCNPEEKDSHRLKNSYIVNAFQIPEPRLNMSEAIASLSVHVNPYLEYPGVIKF